MQKNTDNKKSKYIYLLNIIYLSNCITHM